MQTEITADDHSQMMKVDIMATFSYEDSIGTLKNIIGDDFSGYADDMDNKLGGDVHSLTSRFGL